MKIPAELLEDSVLSQGLVESIMRDAIEGRERPGPPREADPRKWPASGFHCPNCGGGDARVEYDYGDRHWCPDCKITFDAQLFDVLEPPEAGS